MKPRNILLLILCAVICEGAGVIGSFFTISAISTWYVALSKPSFNPPNWVFGPVWTTLYLLMGISLYLVLKKASRRTNVKTAVLFFGAQLVLNSLWSIVFFGGHSPLGGLVVIGFLWVFIVLSGLKFWKISPPAGLLLVPYLLWVSFASLLNFAIYQLN